MTNRLHSFRVIVALLLAGVLLDCAVTGLGVARDRRYEQNPLVAGLPTSIAWLAATAFLLLFVWRLYVAGRTVIPRREKLGYAVAIATALLTFERWVVVVVGMLGLRFL